MQCNHFVPAVHSSLLQSLGISNQSPVGLALFGALLCGDFGNIPVGHRFSMLAMALLGKLESKDVAGEVMSLVSRVSLPIIARNELVICYPLFLV